MAWLTKKRPARGAASGVGSDASAPGAHADDAFTTDWSSDDPTGEIMVVHERIASSSPPVAPILAGPVLDGAVSASVLEKVDGLMQQVQYDLSIGHHLEADQLLRERLKASRIDLTDEQITALVDELAPVDYARHARERLEAEEEHQAAEAAGEGTR